jgi:hypothetical protein
MPENNSNFYLKCNYSTEGAPHIMPWEYLITFNVTKESEGANVNVVLPEGDWPPKGRDWTIVQKCNVKIIDEKIKAGIIKLADYRELKKESKALVRISNIDGVSAFYVPLEDIVKQ